MPAIDSLRGRERERGSPDAEPPSVPLGRLPVEEKLDRLLASVRGRKKALIITHDNPDPDSMAAGVALGFLLERKAGIETRVGYGGTIGRAENTAFVRVLKLPVYPVSTVDFEEYDLFGVVDTQPCVRNHSLPPRFPADMVFDHHPLRDESLQAPFADVGGDFGATSTMIVEYLRAAGLEPSPEVATALFYGLKADTRDLGRQTAQRDIDAYLWLFPRCDKQLLGLIEHPALPVRYFKLYHRALEKARVHDTAVVTDLGDVYSPDMVAEVAERHMYIEDMKWSLASGTYRNQLYFSLRVKDRRMNAGRLIREVCEPHGGSSGGHGSMAGARLPLSGTRAQRQAHRRAITRSFLEAFGVDGTKPVPLLELE
jgi:nanoRNase/pAp phosphatase (c-di-AMP/oligoRNAs hydrolase)